MKRFVLPLLLSAVYVSLLTAIFTSDFGQEHNFLFEEPAFTATAELHPEMDMSLLPASPAPVAEPQLQSPESPLSNPEDSPASAQD